MCLFCFPKRGVLRHRKLNTVGLLTNQNSDEPFFYLKRELEPYHIYELAAKEFGIQEYANALKDMVRKRLTTYILNRALRIQKT